MKTTDGQIKVLKGWGHEIWITNNEVFCGKLLTFNKDKSFSWHFHKLKHEVFFVQSGRVKLFYGWEDDLVKAQNVELSPGDSFEIQVGLRHKILALEDSLVFEFSTTHLESDSYRIVKGD
jgi:mannose-6-phosphate isomerase-like protein (cupin superfamily)